MLYPPPPPHEHHQTPLNISPENLTDDLVDDEDKSSSSSSDREQQKLTRAQRKRLRKKKLRQAASQRRPIIGPLLPTHTYDTPVSDAYHGPVLDEAQPVRHNAAEESVSGIGNSEEQGVSINQNKLKQRKMAKKLTRDLKEQKDSSHRGL